MAGMTITTIRRSAGTWLRSQRVQVGLLLLAGFFLRFALATAAPHPGIADSNHYYNLARNLADGRGFVIDYIWQYNSPPEGVTHPTDYWMPLPAVWTAAGFAILGDGLLPALIPSVLLGTMLGLLTYGLAATAGLDHTSRLLAMAMVIVLPEFVLNSVRTDTTISYVLWVGLAMLCFYLGMRRRPSLLLLAGVFGALAQLTRQDGILIAPTFVVSALIYRQVSDRPIPWRWLMAAGLAWALVLSPWLWRNYQLFGVLFPGGASRTFFMTSFIDQFTYGRELNLEHYLAWGWPNILGNIAFHILANVKTMYTVLDVGLPVAAVLSLAGLVWQREREHLLLLTPALMLVAGLFLFYSLLTPFHSMGGSFKKSYMILIPFLAVASAWGLTTFVKPRRAALLAAGVMAVFMLLNAIELVRADFNAAARYDRAIAVLAADIHELGDVNGDDVITVMTQDPYILNYHGFPALMLPSDDRDTILAACYRYHVDYIILPADRPALDPLYDGSESDPHLPLITVTAPFRLLVVADPSHSTP